VVKVFRNGEDLVWKVFGREKQTESLLWTKIFYFGVWIEIDEH